MERPWGMPKAEHVVGLGIVVGLIVALPMCFQTVRLSLLAVLLALGLLIVWARRKKKETMAVICRLLFLAVTFTFMASSVLSVAMQLHTMATKPAPPAKAEQAPQPTPPERHH